MHNAWMWREKRKGPRLTAWMWKRESVWILFPKVATIWKTDGINNHHHKMCTFLHIRQATRDGRRGPCCVETSIKITAVAAVKVELVIKWMSCQEMSLFSLSTWDAYYPNNKGCNPKIAWWWPLCMHVKTNFSHLILLCMYLVSQTVSIFRFENHVDATCIQNRMNSKSTLYLIFNMHEGNLYPYVHLFKTDMWKSVSRIRLLQVLPIVMLLSLKPK